MNLSGRSATPDWLVSSAFFTSETAARDALLRLLGLGLPRDLIEIVVLKKDLHVLQPGTHVRRPTPRAASAARGALIGLISLSLVSAALIVLAGSGDDHFLTFIMLLGPNVGVVLGAIVGFVIGGFDTFQLPPRLQRVHQDRGILMVVRSKTATEAEAVVQTLQACHGEGVEGPS